MVREYHSVIHHVRKRNAVRKNSEKVRMGRKDGVVKGERQKTQNQDTKTSVTSGKPSGGHGDGLE